MNFENFIGNAEIKGVLGTAFDQGRVPQAIILQGDDGLGKRTLARLIARAVVCSGENPPCGKCPSCVRALAGSHPDIRIEEGTGVSGTISVDTVRAITEDAYRKPEESDCNVYLLFVKTKLSEPSQNKLLKVMEEPPGSALFIITVNSAEALLPTIRSRAQIFTLRPVAAPEAAAFLLESGQAESLENAKELAELHGGNIGKMIGGNALATELAREISALFDSSDEDALLAATGKMLKDRDLFTGVLALLAAVFRDACVFREGAESRIGCAPKESMRLSRTYRKQNLLALSELCGQFIPLVGRNANMNLLVTSFCAKMREIVSK